jgi:predicted HTH domain antitoxin
VSIAMSSDMANEAIDQILHTHEEERGGLIVREYVKDRLIFFKKNNILNIERYVTEIYNEIKHCIYDYNNLVERWYMS